MAIPQKIRKSIQSQAKTLLVKGSRFKRFDQIRQRHFWSTYRFTADANGFIPSGTFEMFTTPTGQAGQGFAVALTGRETNWAGQNRVPDNQNIELTEVGVSALIANATTQAQQNSPYPGALEDELLRNMSLNIKYLTNEIPLGLCVDFAQPAGVSVGEYHPSVPNAYTTDAAPPPAVSLPVNGTEGIIIPPDDVFYTNGFAAPGLRRRFKIPILLQHGETFSFSFGIDAGRGPWLGTGVVIDCRMDFWATESFVEKS